VQAQPGVTLDAVEDRESSGGVSRHEVRNRPWRQRPRRSVAQMFDGAVWRLIVLPFSFAPLMIAKLIWASSGARDWILLGLSLIPWGYFALWQRRPVGQATTHR
jgi:hypothetical protein